MKITHFCIMLLGSGVLTAVFVTNFSKLISVTTDLSNSDYYPTNDRINPFSNLKIADSPNNLFWFLQVVPTLLLCRFYGFYIWILFCVMLILIIGLRIIEFRFQICISVIFKMRVELRTSDNFVIRPFQLSSLRWSWLLVSSLRNCLHLLLLITI